MVEIHEYDLNVLLNSFSEGICYLNAQGALVRCNSIAQLHWDAHLFNDQLTSQAVVSRALAGEQIYYELTELDAQHVLLISAIPLFNGTNTVTGIVIISQNISEPVLMERQAQIALSVLLEALLDTPRMEEIDESLRRIAVLIPQLEPVDDSIAFRVDKATGRLIPIAHFGSDSRRYQEWHAELTALKLEAEEVLRRSSPAYLRTMHLARPLMFNFTTNSTISNPRKLSAAIYAPISLNGQVIGILGAERHRPLDDSGTYFPDWGIDLLAALARLTSLSIEKTALLEMAQQTQTAEAAIQRQLVEQEEFLLLAAHELKNPLTAIRGHAGILQRRIQRFSSPQQTHDLLQSLQSIDHQSRRIELMINTLLEVNRADLDRLEINFEEVDLLQLTRRILQEYLPLAPDHELRLFVNGNEVPLTEADAANHATAICVQGDAYSLEHIIINLLSNAIKYSPERDQINVSLQELPENTTELSVQDHGIGIPYTEQAHIGERFYRAENARASNVKGLGLGLYLINELVKKHHGKLSVQSTGVPGKGSTFSIRLPRQQP